MNRSSRRQVVRWLSPLLATPFGSSAGQTISEIRLAPPNARLEAEFTRVTSVRELADGRVLVSDAGETKLFVADFGRQTLMQIGRAGQGPNEYTAISQLIPLANDSTLLPDVRGGRWLLLHGAEIVATVPPDSPPLRSGARNPFGADWSGHVLTVSPVRSLEGSGTTSMAAEDSLWIQRISRSDGSSDTLGKARARPSRITVTGRERAQSVSIVVNPLAVGDQVLLFSDGWSAIARVDPYRIDWVSDDGRLVRGVALPHKRVSVDEGVKRWVLDEIARDAGRPAQKPEDVKSDWPNFIPPFLTNSVMAAPDAMLWIRRAGTERASPTTYDVVDRRGHIVRRVVMARNERVVGFGAATVYTVATDDDGIQRLRRHQTIR